MWSATVFVTWERESTCPTSEAQKFEDYQGSVTWLNALTTPQPFLVLGDKFHDGCLKMVADQAQLAHREAALPELDPRYDGLRDADYLCQGRLAYSPFDAARAYQLPNNLIVGGFLHGSSLPPIRANIRPNIDKSIQDGVIQHHVVKHEVVF